MKNLIKIMFQCRKLKNLDYHYCRGSKHFQCINFFNDITEGNTLILEAFTAVRTLRNSGKEVTERQVVQGRFSVGHRAL